MLSIVLDAPCSRALAAGGHGYRKSIYIHISSFFAPNPIYFRYHIVNIFAYLADMTQNAFHTICIFGDTGISEVFVQYAGQAVC